MIGEDAHGLFARLRSSVTNKFTNWSKPAAILENDSDLTLDKVKTPSKTFFLFQAFIRCEPLQPRRRHRIRHPSFEPADWRAAKNRRRLAQRSAPLARSHASSGRTFSRRPKSNNLCPFLFLKVEKFILLQSFLSSHVLWPVIYYLFTSALAKFFCFQVQKSHVNKLTLNYKKKTCFVLQPE